MAKVLKVTSKQVKAARAEVVALQAAGRQPDPLVVKIADTPLRGETRATGTHKVGAVSRRDKASAVEA